jgi:PTH1 family peptidyl-tRNA hydrolase
MASIIGALGTDQIPRLRVGVGEPSRGELADWVLSEFSRSERPLLDKVLEVAVEAVHRWIEGEAMDRLAAAYNGMSLS